MTDLSIANQVASPQRFVKQSTVAARYEVSIATVKRWVQSGELPSVLIGGCRRISEADLVKFAGRAMSDHVADSDLSTEASGERR